MAGDRTMVTELGTALGTLPYPDLATAIEAQPATLRVDDRTWERLCALHADDDHSADFAIAYRNGQTFAAAADGLRGRPPRLIEWAGGRRAPGDEVAPIDLVIDHVYLISCKYLSANLANSSPARLIQGLLATTGTWARTDWYATVAPGEYQYLYAACKNITGLSDLPDLAVDMTNAERGRLSDALPGRRYPDGTQDAYRQLCDAISQRSARRWATRLAESDPERVLWRLLRIGSAPYYLLGAHQRDSLLLRVDTPWDWRQRYHFRSLHVAAAHAGQPRVDWTGYYTNRATSTIDRVDGHVEIRWSHGRFAQPPEAKIYLDTPVDHVPGYHPLDP